MKKILFAATTLLVLAGSTVAIPTVQAASASAASTRPVAKPASIPPPSCPVDEPHGCGIFG